MPENTGEAEMSAPGRIVEGRKDDAGKDPWDLAPWDAFRAIVAVLGFGARKYTHTYCVPVCHAGAELAKYCTCGTITKQLNVIQSAVTPQKVCASSATSQSTQKLKERHVIQTGSHTSPENAESATIGNSNDKTPNTLQNNSSISSDGSHITESERTGRGASTGSVPECGIGARSGIGTPCSQGLDSPGKMSSLYLRPREGAAGSVASDQVEDFSTLTTITKPDASGDSSATAATKASASWETLKSLLNEHSRTCVAGRLALKSLGHEVEITVPGARNWEHGMAWSRLYAATLRHLTAWWEGEAIDAETGLSHLAHAGCCICFLIAYERRRVGTDDRARIAKALARSA